MVAVMRAAAKLDDNANIANEEQVVAMNRLMIENKVSVKGQALWGLCYKLVSVLGPSWDATDF